MRTIATWTVLTTMAMIATATAHPARAADCAALLHTKLPDTTLTIAQAAPSGRFTPPYGRAVDKIPAFCRQPLCYLQKDFNTEDTEKAFGNFWFLPIG